MSKVPASSKSPTPARCSSSCEIKSYISGVGAARSSSVVLRGYSTKGLHMLKALTPLIGAMLLAGTTALYAQAPAQTPPANAGKGGPHGGGHFDCKDAKDQAACEQRRDKMK